MPYIIQTRDDRNAPWSDGHEQTEYDTLERASEQLAEFLEAEPHFRIREWCNGFANVETYNAVLHIDNDPRWQRRALAFCQMARHKATRAQDKGGPILNFDHPPEEIERQRQTWAENTAGEKIRAMIESAQHAIWESISGPRQNGASRDRAMALSDMGSLDRIDWRHVARHYLDKLEEGVR